jgi:hypothetical protein
MCKKTMTGNIYKECSYVSSDYFALNGLLIGRNSFIHIKYGIVELRKVYLRIQNI